MAIRVSWKSPAFRWYYTIASKWHYLWEFLLAQGAHIDHRWSIGHIEGESVTEILFKHFYNARQSKTNHVYPNFFSKSFAKTASIPLLLSWYGFGTVVDPYGNSTEETGGWRSEIRPSLCNNVLGSLRLFIAVSGSPGDFGNGIVKSFNAFILTGLLWFMHWTPICMVILFGSTFLVFAPVLGINRACL